MERLREPRPRRAATIVQADADAATGANQEVLQTIASSPFVFPTPELEAMLYQLPCPGRGRDRRVERPVQPDLQSRSAAGTASEADQRLPYVLSAPALLWLLLLFLIPMFAMASLSLQEGTSLEGFRQTFRFANFTDAIADNGEFLLRSLRNAAIVTIAALLLAYPVAYWIAFYGGRFKSVFLFLLLLPFFISFVIRTVPWSFILSDDGLDPRHAEDRSDCCRRPTTCSARRSP